MHVCTYILNDEQNHTRIEWGYAIEWWPFEERENKSRDS